VIPLRPSPLVLRLALTVALAAMAGASLARAQAPAANSDEPDTSSIAGVPDVPSVGLTLEQARRLGIDHAPISRAARGGLQVARGSRMVEAGAFDPVLFGEGSRTRIESPVTSPFAASEISQRSLGGGASWLSPIGTELLVSLSQVETESNAPFTTQPTERRTHARVDVVQPLLKGFGSDATRGQLRAADRELEAAQRLLEAANRRVEAETENAYWELYAAERDFLVSRLQRQRAAVFLRDQVLRSRAGVVGPAAVAVARTFLAEQEATLLDARVRLGANADRLAEVIGVPPRPGERYRALDTPPLPPAPEPLDTLLARALTANPELIAFEENVRAARARARAAAWNAWPSIDAFGGYGGSGLAGIGQRVVFGADTIGADFDTDFSSAWDQTFGDDFPDWGVGVRVNVPIGWRADRGDLERRRGELEMAEAALDARRLSLETEVRRAHREADDSRRQLDAIETLVESAEEQVRVARLTYQSGRGTAYDLVNIETDLVRARYRESLVLVRVARAATELRRLTTPASGRTR